MERLISLAAGYAFGLFQTGYIIGRVKKIDIRKKGSGNAGSTNALRVMGWKAGLMTFAGDVAKCVAAVLLVRYIFKGSDILPALSLYAGLGATLGHNYPFYMKFKGGKGIAVLAGIIMVSGPWFIPIPLAAFFTVVLLTKLVSLGSLLTATLFFLETVILGQTGVLDTAKPCLYEMYFITFVIMTLAWWRHKDNIQRMLKGNELEFNIENKESR